MALPQRYTYQWQAQPYVGPGQVLRHDARGYYAGAPLNPNPQLPADFYANLIKGDPLYNQGTQDLRASTDAAGTNSADAIRRMLIQYGVVPEGFKDPYGWVNDETKQLAGKNTEAGLSTFARLKRAYDMATKKGSRDLAARGMLQSGALTQQRGENDLLYRQNQSDAVNQLLEGAGSARSSYADTMRQAEAQRTQLAQSAAERAAAFAPPTSAPKLPPKAPVVSPIRSVGQLVQENGLVSAGGRRF